MYKYEDGYEDEDVRCCIDNRYFEREGKICFLPLSVILK
jgi:hypothetical protein